jgi:hypothetical protein
LINAILAGKRENNNQEKRGLLVQAYSYPLTLNLWKNNNAIKDNRPITNMPVACANLCCRGLSMGFY